MSQRAGAGRVVVREWPAAPAAAAAFRRLAGEANPFFLDSSLPMPRWGRWSVVGGRPFLVLSSRGREIEERTRQGARRWRADPFDALREALARFEAPDEGFPFAGGAAGFLSYDLGAFVERLPRTTLDDAGFPEMWFGFYDRAAVFDHEQGRAWLAAVELGGGAAGAETAEQKLADLARRLAGPAVARETGPACVSAVTSNFTRDKYLAAVARAKRYIAAGDIFQVNISQRLHARIGVSPVELYLRLREVNPAPYAAFLAFDDKAVLSSSPELYLDLRGRRVVTRPIKGTRPRGATPAEDERLKEELLASEKEKAELAMIVDLERNDLGRVCEYGSVRVTEPRVMEPYRRVWHGVATVEGTLREGMDRVDLLRAAFPGGSITGAPKVRAMEIIDELEPTRRSVYTGAIGWLGFEGGMALNVAIRTFLTRGQDAFFQVGGGIVADSDEAAEYEETLHKAHGLMDSLGRAADDGERRPRMIADDGERRRTEMAMVSGGRAEGDPDNHGRFVDQRRVRG